MGSAPNVLGDYTPSSTEVNDCSKILAGALILRGGTYSSDTPIQGFTLPAVVSGVSNRGGTTAK